MGNKALTLVTSNSLFLEIR